jgi:acyl-CoA synthetase (AMP-forming)/AMP-acid ligase II
VDRISDGQKAALGLSALDIMVSGAERVRSETLVRFSRAFAGCGLRPEALTPAYGLAEWTLLVSANVRLAAGAYPAALSVSREQLRAYEPDAAGGQQSIEAVSCGRVNRYDQRVAIVDPGTLLPVSAGWAKSG